MPVLLVEKKGENNPSLLCAIILNRYSNWVALQVPTIHFTTVDGAEYAVEATVGFSVMNAAVAAGVEGIDADCGGGCACGTCHVHVAREWMGKSGTTGRIGTGITRVCRRV